MVSATLNQPRSRYDIVGFVWVLYWHRKLVLHFRERPATEAL
jgi:hypothetical protein